MSSKGFIIVNMARIFFRTDGEYLVIGEDPHVYLTLDMEVSAIPSDVLEEAYKNNPAEGDE